MLQKPVDGVAELGSRERSLLVARSLRSGPWRQTEDALGEVPVGAALEQGKRAVGQSPDVVQRRSRNVRELRQLDAQTRSPCGNLVEERELRDLGRALVGSGVDPAGGRLGLEAVDAQHEAGVVALELDRSPVGCRNGLVCVEPVEHPADRRGAVVRAFRIDCAGDDQPVDGSCHRDVVEAEALRALLVTFGLANLLEVEHRVPVAAGGMHHAKPEAPVGERDDLVGPARPADVAAGIRDDHYLELEPLRGVDREQPDGATTLLHRHGLELLRAERVLLADESHEAREVRASDRLVVARETSQLAEVGKPP